MGCGLLILDRFILKVLDNTWHSKCLKCSHCNEPLKEKCFVRDSDVFCKEDFFRYAQKIGIVKKSPILKAFLIVENLGPNVDRVGLIFRHRISYDEHKTMSIIWIALHALYVDENWILVTNFTLWKIRSFCANTTTKRPNRKVKSFNFQHFDFEIIWNILQRRNYLIG